jgi:hypothetical protein
VADRFPKFGIPAVLNRLAVPARRWRRLAMALRQSGRSRRATVVSAFGNIHSIASFWDGYFETVDDPSRPFPLAQILVPHVRLLEPLATAQAMEAEALKMDNCLRDLVWQAVQGYRIYIRLRGRTPVTAELVKTANGWKPGQILGPRNRPVEAALRTRIEQELADVGRRLMTAGGSARPDPAAPMISRMQTMARDAFQQTEIEEKAEALCRIRGRSRAWTDGAYAIFTAEAAARSSSCPMSTATNILPKSSRTNIGLTSATSLMLPP